jgi:hypothetical protein
VTDLGTEFGVEVDQAGNHDIQVFAGRVKVQLPPGDDGQPREIHLTEDKAIRFEATSSVIFHRAATPERFVRSIARTALQTISVNFTHGPRSNLTPAEKTGVMPTDHWNNVDGDVLPPPSAILLHNRDGKDTRAMLSWRWSHRSTDLPYRTYFNSMPPPVYPFEKLMDG